MDKDNEFMELVSQLMEQGFTQQEAIDEAKERLGMAYGGRIGLRQGTSEEGISSLNTGAPDITYEGNEGPKAPMQMTDVLLREEYDRYVYDLLEQRPDATPMSFEEFKMMVIAE